MGRSVFREAVSWQEQALRALGHLPETRQRMELAVDVRFLLRNCLTPLGEWRRALDYLSEAEIVLEKLGDQRRQSFLWSLQTSTRWLLGEHDFGIEPGHRALRAAIAVRDPLLIIGARYQLSMPYWGRGDYRRAFGYVSENHEALAEGVLSDAVLAAIHPTTNHPAVASHAMAAWYLAELGDFARAEAFGQEAVRRGEALQRYGLTLALFHLGGAYLRQGEAPRAVATLERCRELCETNDYQFYLSWASARLGAAYLLAGRITDSVGLLKRMVEIDAARTSQAEISLWCGWLAEAYLASGQPTEANAMAARALELAVSHGERGNQGWALRLQAQLAAQQASPDVDGAEGLYRQAFGLAEELEMQPLQAHCHLGLGELYGRGRRIREARTELEMALEMLRAMGMSFWIPRAEAALAALPSMWS